MSDSNWERWLAGIPREEQDALFRLLGQKRLPGNQEEGSVRVTRTPTAELYVRESPPYEDVFSLLELYRRLAFRSNLLLKGPKGDGKSLSIITFASQNNIPIVIQESSEDTKKYDLQGSQFLIGSETVYVLGCIPTAIDVANETGKCILLLEELNALTPQVQKQLNAVADFRKMSSLPHIGRVYRLREGAMLWIVATMNPSVYGGTYDLNEDLKSRFEEIEVTYPNPAQERRILKAACPNLIQDAQLDLIIRMANESRQQATGYALSTRDLVRLVHTVAQLGLDTAIQLVLCKFEGDDRNTIIKRINSIFGPKGWKSYWGVLT